MHGDFLGPVRTHRTRTYAKAAAVSVASLRLALYDGIGTAHLSHALGLVPAHHRLSLLCRGNGKQMRELEASYAMPY